MLIKSHFTPGVTVYEAERIHMMIFIWDWWKRGLYVRLAFSRN